MGKWVLPQAFASYNFTGLVDNQTNKECAIETLWRYGVGFGVGSCRHLEFYGTIDASVDLIRPCGAERFCLADVCVTLSSTLQISSAQRSQYSNRTDNTLLIYTLEKRGVPLLPTGYQKTFNALRLAGPTIMSSKVSKTSKMELTGIADLLRDDSSYCGHL